MELNREQIIKALECCTNADEVCDECTLLEDRNCGVHLLKYALSLIKELTEEKEHLFKELAEEIEKNNRLTEENDKIIIDRFCISTELDAMRGAANAYKIHCKKLTEEVERLKRAK